MIRVRTSLCTSFLCFLAVALCALPIIASAQQAFTNKSINLRAGPARDYPLVAGIGPGASVTVIGCLSDYRWCDVVVAGNNRGWVFAQNLSYPYQGNRVPIYGYGTAIGLPIIAFSIGNYWGSHYRYRPWYRNQSQWANRPHYRPRPPVNRPHRPGCLGIGCNKPNRPGHPQIQPPRPKPPGNGGSHGGNRPGFGNGGSHGGNGIAPVQPARPKPQPGNGGSQGGNGVRPGFGSGGSQGGNVGRPAFGGGGAQGGNSGNFGKP